MYQLINKQLSFTALIMAGVAGIEPANDGIKTRCLTTWLHPIRLLYLQNNVLIVKFVVECVKSRL